MNPTRLFCVVVPFAALTIQPVFAEPPETPRNLSSSVYSTTAAEIFWDRSSDNNIVVGYQVLRNGTLVEMIDALSYFDSSLEPGTTYSYQLIAVDDEGNKSAVASTIVQTPTLGNDAALAAPENLTASVYSQSSTELFWDRVSTDILSYEIIQNGEMVATSAGTSFYTNGLAPNVEYTFGVVAVNESGTRSSPTTVIVSTSDDSTGSENTAADTIGNLNIVVYSSTAAELFWDRLDGISNSASIIRNGEFIATVDGNSFFDDSRASGELYQYIINANDSTGSIVASATLDESNTGGTANPDDNSQEEDAAEPTLENSTAGIFCDYVDVSFNDSPSVNANSTSTWSCSETERSLVANGVPDHEVGVFPNEGNPNTLAEQEVAVAYTLNPTQSESITTLGGPSGPQGYVLNGVKIDASTAGSCEDTGTTCSLVDNSGSWNIEALGHTAFNFGTDENNAHVQPGGAYHYHGMPEGFIAKQGGSESTMTLIAWAADGFPIYARYGYSDANDSSSVLISMIGSYQLIESVSTLRPSVDTYELGTFAQDWEYVEGSGDLDECNGRVGVTPEFPNGIYHYFATDSYPYFQRCVTGNVTTAEGAPGGPPPGGTPPVDAPAQSVLVTP